MKLAILSDIHEANDLLREAIAKTRDRGADRFIVLGDLVEMGQAVRETVAILAEVGAVGVYGNHDLGLAVYPTERMRRRYGEDLLAYFTALRGHHHEADCLFSHAQAWMDPADIQQPWYVHDIPETPDLLAQNFAATDRRVLFQGHYHRWLAATPEGRLGWAGEGPLRLEPTRRYLIVAHAVCDGWCALYDTETRELEPIALSTGGPRAGP